MGMYAAMGSATTSSTGGAGASTTGDTKASSTSGVGASTAGGAALLGLARPSQGEEMVAGSADEDRAKEKHGDHEQEYIGGEELHWHGGHEQQSRRGG